ncbi:MAG: hypothetical protein ACYDCK_06630 [Thermoplasmatota archaeon]
MIASFARMFGNRDRVVSVAPVTGAPTDLEVFAGEGTAASANPKGVVGSDQPPAAFVEKMAYDGGDVYVIPFVEAFKKWSSTLRGRKE